MLAIGMIYVAFLVFSYTLCFPDLSKAFNMKECWIFLKVLVSKEIAMKYLVVLVCLYGGLH